MTRRVGFNIENIYTSCVYDELMIDFLIIGNAGYKYLVCGVFLYKAVLYRLLYTTALFVHYNTLAVRERKKKSFRVTDYSTPTKHVCLPSVCTLSTLRIHSFPQRYAHKRETNAIPHSLQQPVRQLPKTAPLAHKKRG